MEPDLEKLRAVKEFAKQVTKTQARAFLGPTGYYATVALPLTDLTKKLLPDKVKWSAECDTAFRSLKDVLCRAPVLGNPNFTRQYILQTDASDRGVGAVLSQIGENGQEDHSKKLLPRECRNSTVEKECLAIKLGVEAFRVYLLGRDFTVQTDHRSLVWLDRLKDKNMTLAR